MLTGTEAVSAAATRFEQGFLTLHRKQTAFLRGLKPTSLQNDSQALDTLQERLTPILGSTLDRTAADPQQLGIYFDAALTKSASGFYVVKTIL